MHPLLTRIARLGLYLLAWIPVAIMLVYFLASTGRLGLLETTVLAVPLCFVYAILCLYAWYPCRANPLRRTAVPRLLVTHLAAAAFTSFLWLQAARAFAHVLSLYAPFPGLSARFAPLTPILFGVGVLLYLLSVAFHYLLLGIEESRQAEAAAIEARVLARDAELKALKAQVNPHFLFNSLNSISALTTADPAKAREMCVLLADFLRKTLGLGEKNSITLQQEMAMLDGYLQIEKVRFGSRLQFADVIVDDAKDCLLPPLLLQPLVENAVTHGIANLPDGGKIHIAAHCANGRLLIAIENSFDPEATSHRRTGLGLKNVRQRLEARYGADATLTVGATEDRFRAEVGIPVEREEHVA